MTGQQKFDLFRAHMRMIRRVKRSAVRAAHPDWSDPQVNREMARLFLHGC